MKTEMRRRERVRERRAREGMKRVTQRKASSGLTPLKTSVMNVACNQPSSASSFLDCGRVSSRIDFSTFFFFSLVPLEHYLGE
jgi:hypothetical protein